MTTVQFHTVLTAVSSWTAEWPMDGWITGGWTELYVQGRARAQQLWLYALTPAIGETIEDEIYRILMHERNGFVIKIMLCYVNFIFNVINVVTKAVSTVNG